MANFPVDPRPHIPSGFNLVHVDYLGPPERPRVFLGALTEKSFENVAIATFIPRVDNRDFNLIAGDLRRVMQHRYRIPDIEVQPSAIGDAFVSFSSSLERQRFVNSPPINIGDYHVHFERHDEVANATSVDIDREVWLMLLCYPLDCRSFGAVAKSIGSFALLQHIHEPDVPARVIVKAVVHDHCRIPPHVVVSTGCGRATKSWTVPIYVLSSQDLVIPPDEAPVPPHGLPHPIPPPAPRWLGPAPWHHAEHDQVANDPMGNVHDNMVQEHNAAIEEPADDPMSPVAEDFMAYGGALMAENNHRTEEVAEEAPAIGLGTDEGPLETAPQLVPFVPDPAINMTLLQPQDQVLL